MSINQPNVVVIGSINMDMVTKSNRFPKKGETITGQSFHQLPGGKGANQAVAAALPYNPHYDFRYHVNHPREQTNLGQKPKLGGVRVSHRLYILAYAFTLFIGVHTFHCIIHASLFSFSRFLFVCLSSLRKPKKICFFFFACWELSRVNSFLFLWVKVEDIGYNVQWLLHAYMFSFQRAILLCLLLCVCLQIPALVQCTSTLIIVHIVRSCK